MNAIDVRDLAKTYPGQASPAVDGVSFSVAKGELFGLLGPNGAGKTTTQRVLATLLPPGSGSVRVAGFDVVRETAEVRRRIGVVPQDVALYPKLTAKENLRAFGGLYGLFGRELSAKVDDVLERVDLLASRDGVLETFSGGMKRRVNIAAGLLNRSEVLLLDEPTVGVDPQSRLFILEGIKRLVAEGVTVLLTTHDMEEAERLCRRVAIMDHGRILACDAPQSLVDAQGGGTVSFSLANAVPPDLLASLQRLPEVDAADPAPGALNVKTRETARVLPRILSALEAAGASVSSIEILQPSLETVFLGLTGKRLRD